MQLVPNKKEHNFLCRKKRESFATNIRCTCTEKGKKCQKADKRGRLTLFVCVLSSSLPNELAASERALETAAAASPTEFNWTQFDNKIWNFGTHLALFVTVAGSVYRLLPSRGGGDGVNDIASRTSASSSIKLTSSSASQSQRGSERVFGLRGATLDCIGSFRFADNKCLALAILIALAVAVLVSLAATGGGRHSYPRVLAREKEKPPMLDSAALRALTSSASEDFTSNATAPPVVIALMNRFYFGDRYERIVPGCTWEKTGARLPSEFTSDQARFKDSSAVAFHIPGMSKEMLNSAQQHRMSKNQALVGVSMESAPNYPLLADEKFLSRFDLLATLVPPREDDGNASVVSTPRQISYPYYDDMFRRCWAAQGNPDATAAAAETPQTSSSLQPPHHRESAIAYVNSNCATKTKRDEIVKEITKVLQPLGILLHSFGRCLNNMPRTARADSKVDTLRWYKFCIAIENSEDPHYVSEKVYDAFVAGCVPIYFGAPNVLDYVPHRDAIIDVRALGGARQAAEEIARLAIDAAAYAAKHGWRDRPETWSDWFKRLQSQTWRDGVGPFKRCDTTLGLSDPHMRRQCAICREVAEWRDSEQ